MTPRPGLRRGPPRGMTLLEVLIALSILAAIVLALVSALRVGLRAWEAGEERAASHQELRAVVELVTEALATAFPYRGARGTGPGRTVLFEGEPQAVRFVTTAAPLVLDAPATPFHAVALGYTEEERLTVIERLVPAEEPFPEGPRSVLSRAVTGLRLAYLDEQGDWQERWDGQAAQAIPAAVRVELTLLTRGQPEAVPPFVVPIALGKQSP